ncbi:MAG: TIGR01777 family oxidoreductase [Anaerolineales bacterium]|nr:TIGR01777 family oxidoreductase [Anaerolineales bacterium]
MHVLIAGGGGLIGRALTTDLLRENYSVTILSRHAGSIQLPSGAQALHWDGINTSGWERELERTDAVVHLSGESIAGTGILPQRWTAEKRGLIRSSRVSTGKVLSVAIDAAGHKPAVFIQASAVGYYGPLGSQPINESQPPGSDYLSDVCMDWEASSADIEVVGVRRSVARFGLPLSMEGGILPRLALPLRMFVGGPLGSGRQYCPWIHMADTVGALRFLIENDGAHGVFNITAPEPVTNAEFTRILARALRRPDWLSVPGFAFRALFGEIATIVLSGQRALPQRLLTAGYVFRYPDLREALQDLMSE